MYVRTRLEARENYTVANWQIPHQGLQIAPESTFWARVDPQTPELTTRDARRLRIEIGCFQADTVTSAG